LAAIPLPIAAAALHDAERIGLIAEIGQNEVRVWIAGPKFHD
jgi:hypothetical protein